MGGGCAAVASPPAGSTDAAVTPAAPRRAGPTVSPPQSSQSPPRRPPANPPAGRGCGGGSVSGTRVRATAAERRGFWFWRNGGGQGGAKVCCEAPWRASAPEPPSPARRAGGVSPRRDCKRRAGAHGRRRRGRRSAQHGGVARPRMHRRRRRGRPCGPAVASPHAGPTDAAVVSAAHPAGTGHPPPAQVTPRRPPEPLPAVTPVFTTILT